MPKYSKNHESGPGFSRRSVINLLALSFFSVLLCFSSCKDSASDSASENNSGAQEYCSVSLSVKLSEDVSRAINPKINLENLYYYFECIDGDSNKVYETPASGENGKSYAEILELSIKILKGSYMFVLTAYLDSTRTKHVLDYTSELMEVTPGSLNLECTLKEPEFLSGTDANGTVDLKFELPPFFDAKEVYVNIAESTETKVESKTNIHMGISVSEGERQTFSYYNRNNLPRGYYKVTVKITDHFNNTTQIPYLMYIAGGLTSGPEDGIDTSGKIAITESEIDVNYTRFVSSSGNDDTGTGFFNSPYATIERAVQSINECYTALGNSKKKWTIFVKDSLNLTSPVVLEGTINATNITIKGYSDDVALIGKGKNAEDSDMVVYCNTTCPLVFKDICIKEGGIPANIGAIGGNTNGGGLYIGNGTTECKVTLGDGAVIKDNKAIRGGGVYLNTKSFLYICGSAVIGQVSDTCADASNNSNYAVGEVAANGNLAPNGGGGIFSKGTLKLGWSYEENEEKNSEFTGTISYNYAYAQTYGGGGVCVNAGNFYAQSGHVENNCTYSGGGGFCLSNGSVQNFSNVNIRNNTASTGGGIYAYYGATYNNLNITGNKAKTTGNGGAGVLIYSTASSYFVDCTITGNTASGSGGGICLTSNSTTYSYPLVSICGSTKIGGTGSDANKAKNGSGVYLAQGVLAIGYNELTYSSSGINSPTICTEDANYSGSIIGDVSTQNGAAIYCSSGTGVYFSSKAYVPTIIEGTTTANDLYLCDGAYIYLRSPLTTAVSKIIHITPADSLYGTDFTDETKKVLMLATGATTTIADEASKFQISDYDSKQWFINNDGFIEEVH